MDSKVNYTIVGIFVLLLGAAMVAIALWLTTLRQEQNVDFYLTYVREEVSGLNVQSPVRFNGVKVGYVKSIGLNPKDPQQVEILMAINEGTPVTTSTVAILQAEGITGIKYIGLKALTAEAPLLVAQKGELYPVIPSEPSLLVQLGTAIQEITDSIKNLTSDVNKVFDTQNRQALKNSLQNVEKVTQTLANNAKEIDKSLKSTDILLTNSAKASKQLPKIMDQLHDTLASVKKASTEFGQTSESITSTMSATKVAVQNVSQQVMPSTQALLNHLNHIAGNLQQVSGELQQNPAIIIRGKYPAPPGPGER